MCGRNSGHRSAPLPQYLIKLTRLCPKPNASQSFQNTI
jgi:hypothetical protein